MPAGRGARKREPRFSVVTIVRNEADRLPRLLASLAEFRSRGGEVLVLDTGSDDGTPEVAAAAGCHVVVEPRRFNRLLTERQARRINETFSREGEGPFVTPGERLFNFARARNCAAALARHDVQLVVDGGDVVEALDLEWLDASIRGGRVAACQFDVRVRNRSGWSVEVHDWFFDRRSLHWKGRAHTFLCALPAGRKGETLRLSRRQLLVSHHTDLEKARGYQLAGVALEALADPPSDRWRYFLGRELLARHYFRSALPVLLSLDQAEVPPTVRSASLCFAASCLAGLRASRDEVDSLLIRACRRDSRRRDPLLRLARGSLAEGDMQGAASFAAAALAIPPKAGFSEPEENHSTGPHAILYWALFWLGRRADARHHFEICRRLDPTNPVHEEHAHLFSKAAPRTP